MIKKKILLNYKLVLLFTAIVISLLAIHPNIKSAGVYVLHSEEPSPNLIGHIILEINDMPVNTIEDYNQIVSNITSGDIIRITSEYEKKPYIFEKVESYPFLATTKNNNTFIGLKVGDIPHMRLNFGLELVGGTKLILQPQGNLTQVEWDNVVDILRQRLDLFGVKGATVSTIVDLSNRKYVRAELAGVEGDQALNLLEKEGVFEARIQNTTIFSGSDILDVCISGTQCTMQLTPLQASDGSVLWEFAFELDITNKAAEKFANKTLELDEYCEITRCYLNGTVDFYIDGEIIQGASLNIPSDLKGKSLTSPVITGQRKTQEDAQKEMRFLQSILQSRKLPVKFEILNTHSVSPTIGRQFITNIFWLFLLAILFVDIIIAIRYKKLRLVFITVFISLSEIFITLGVAAMISWNLDIASIAGIIASVGTGIDDQIIILDEVRNKKDEDILRKKINKAFFVVIAAYAVGIASMTPLLFAGAGLLRGFAATSMIGISVGVLITRPAFAELLKLVEKE